MRYKELPIQLSTALLVAVLAGCPDVRLRVNLRGDGSGSAEWRVEIWESAAAAGLTAVALKEKMLEDDDFKKPGVRFATGRSPNGREFLTVTVPFANVAELNDESTQTSFARESGRCRLSLRIRHSAPFPVSAEITMPGRILRSNADEVRGRIARFGNVLRPDGVFVESEAARTALPQVLALAGVLVCAVAILVLWRRRAKGMASSRHSLSLEPELSATPPGEGGSPKVFCGDCGTANRAGARFCRHCGAAL